MASTSNWFYDGSMRDKYNLEYRLDQWPADLSSLNPLAFSGIHIIGKNALEKLFSYPEDKFSITKFYLEYMEELGIYGYPHNDDFVMDLGKLDSLQIAQYLDLRKFL